VDPIKALFWSAVVNGVLAPFLLVALLLVSNDARIMNGQVSSRLTRVVVVLTTMIMFGAAIGMFIF
jgi:Mn2+/Fe2+ NRAMP family transporter